MKLLGALKTDQMSDGISLAVSVKRVGLQIHISIITRTCIVRSELR